MVKGRGGPVEREGGEPEAETLDTNSLYKMFDEWSNIAKWVARIFLFVLLCLGSIRFVLAKPESYHYCAWIRIIGSSMFYDFKDSISINSDSIEDGKLLSSESAQDSVNELIGYAFSAIFVSYLSNMLLYWMHCNNNDDGENGKLADDLDTAQGDEMVDVLANELGSLNNGGGGSKINASALYSSRNDEAMLQLQKSKILMKKGNGHEREFASNFCNFDGLCRYIIEKPSKIAILCRMLVMIFIFQVLNSSYSIEALPVIILYQSFGVSPKWIVIWFSWWIIPIILLLHFSFLTKRYISIMRHLWKYYYAEDDDNNVNNRDLTKSLLDDHANMSNGGGNDYSLKPHCEQRRGSLLSTNSVNSAASITSTGSTSRIGSKSKSKSKSGYAMSDKLGKYVDKGKEKHLK